MGIVISEMSYSTRIHRISKLMINGYGDMTRTQVEVATLFHEKYSELSFTSNG